MRKVFLIFVLCFVVAASGCSTPSEKFYADKSSVTKVERASELNSVFRSALEESDEFEYEIESTYVTAGYDDGMAKCYFYVLTKDGKYLSYEVEGAERIIQICHIYSGPYDDYEEEEPIGKYHFDGKCLYRN